MPRGGLGNPAFGRPWTKEEEERLASIYLEADLPSLLAAFPDRSESSIRNRAYRLRALKRAPWTERDDNNLRMLWGYSTVPNIARTLERSEESVCYRARKLGLGSHGCPTGFVHVSKAARDFGYNLIQLKQILRWAGVRTLPSFSRPKRRGTKYHHHVVDPHLVKEAVERWLSCETLESGCRRHNVGWSTMKRWLKEEGVELSFVMPYPGLRRSKSGSGLHYRIPSSNIDKIVEKYGKLESLNEACRRLKMRRQTLAQWLREAGVMPATNRNWWLDPQTVDALVATKRA